MKKQSFIKPEADKELNPVDYFNFHRTWEEAFEGQKLIINESVIIDEGEDKFSISGHIIEVLAENKQKLTVGKKYTKFMVYAKIQHGENYRAAISTIEFTMLNKDIPYIRVGTDYFKVIYKTDRYGIERKELKAWKKDEIKLDHSASLLKYIHKFDDFCIAPNNINYQVVHNGCYNLYSEFSHKEHTREVSLGDIPYSHSLMNHIFGDQIDIGYQYMKILYELPTRALPVLCLVSKERSTGKTTFINWISIIFGDNYVLINPEDLSLNFNSVYANKNIIGIDETVVDKSQAVEKIKSLATQKMISVNQKHVSNYSIPFFAKLILCTNKVNDFMRIDEDEIRFWVRKVNAIEEINTDIETDLKNEVPMFLKFLRQIPMPDLGKSRMVFTAEQISNQALNSVKHESYSNLHKDLLIYITDFLNEYNDIEGFKATPKDIKDMWFKHNNQISAAYITKVIKDEMKMPQGKMQKYIPFNTSIGAIATSSKTGKPYEFTRAQYIDEEMPVQQEEETAPF